MGVLEVTTLQVVTVREPDSCHRQTSTEAHRRLRLAWLNKVPTPTTHSAVKSEPPTAPNERGPNNKASKKAAGG